MEANRDLRLTVERLAVSHAPKAVLHNLKFAKLFAEEFMKSHGKYVRYNCCQAQLQLQVKLIITTPTQPRKVEIQLEIDHS